PACVSGGKRQTDQVKVPRRVSTKGLWAGVQRRIPCLRWLPKYNFKEDFVSDIISGLTVGVMMIPQSMAYGTLAGLDAAHGLYTSFFSAIFYFLFGTSRHNSVGVVAVTSMMAASTRYRLAPYDFDYYPRYYRTPHWTTHRQKLWQLLPFLQKSITLIHVPAGFLAVLISDQVSAAFTSAVALHVFTAQVDKLLKVKVGRYSGPGKLVRIYYDFFCNIKSTHIPTMGMSLISCAVLYVIKYHVSPICSKKYLKGIQIPVDMILILIYSIFLGKTRSIPTPEFPKLSVVSHTLIDGFTLAIVIYCISISLAKIFAKRFSYKVDPEQEFFALGITHVLCSFFACVPPSAAMARSSVLIGSGGRSQVIICISVFKLLTTMLFQLCSVIAACVVLAVIFLISPLLRALPQVWSLEALANSLALVSTPFLFSAYWLLSSLWLYAI
ncbi:Sulfate transp and Sulfate tra GLY domain contain ing protein, partial [Trichuris trichiura]